VDKGSAAEDAWKLLEGGKGGEGIAGTLWRTQGTGCRACAETSLIISRTPSAPYLADMASRPGSSLPSTNTN